MLKRNCATDLRKLKLNKLYIRRVLKHETITINHNYQNYFIGLDNIPEICHGEA